MFNRLVSVFLSVLLISSLASCAQYPFSTNSNSEPAVADGSQAQENDGEDMENDQSVAKTENELQQDNASSESDLDSSDISNESEDTNISDNVVDSIDQSRLKSLDEDGTIFQDENDTWIQDKNGRIIASYSNGDFDYITSYGDGYYALFKAKSGFENASFEFGFASIKEDEAITYFEPTDSVYYDYAADFSAFFDDCESRVISGDSFAMMYYGGGVFGYRTGSTPKFGIHFFTPKDNVDFTVDNIDFVTISNSSIYPPDLSIDFTKAEYICIPVELDTAIVNPQGVSGYLGSVSTTIQELCPYSDGGFIFLVDTSNDGYDLRFYDCNTSEVTSICPNPDRLVRRDDYVFVDGRAELELIGLDNKTYHAVVDKHGNYIEEPHL